ncbi:MAG: hypothetical protein AAGA17_15615 [Actinomycetota bacterium]
MPDLDSLADRYLATLDLRDAPDPAPRAGQLRRRRHWSTALAVAAVVAVGAAGAVFAVRALDDDAEVRVSGVGPVERPIEVPLDSAPRRDDAAGPGPMWQLDLDRLPGAWTARLTGVTAVAGPPDDITVRYELSDEDRTATLMLIPGALELSDATPTEIRRDGRDIEAQSVAGGSVLAWTDAGVSSLLQGEVDPDALRDLAEGLPVVRAEAIGAVRPDSTGSISGSVEVLGGSVDGIPWRLLVGGDGFVVGLEIDGIIPAWSRWDDASIPSLSGSARATAFSVDGTRFVLVVSTEDDDRVGLAHRDGTRTRFRSTIVESERLVVTPIAVPADVDAPVVAVWNERIGRELLIELPALPRTGWARGEGSVAVGSFPRD